MTEYKNRKGTKAEMEELIKMGIRILPILFLMAIVTTMGIYFYTHQTPPATSESIDNLLAKADVLIIPVVGETISYEIPADVATSIGLDGRGIGVEKYFFSTGGDNPSSATGFSTVPGAHVPGDKEIISFRSQKGNGEIVLKFY